MLRSLLQSLRGPQPRATARELDAAWTHLALRRCRHGLMAYNRHDQYIGRSLERYGEYSELEVAFLRGWLRPGDTVVDAGANIGTITVPIARAVVRDA